MAVVLDATIVRALLVPATMRLLGPWNWVAPRFVRRIYRRLRGHHHAIAEVELATRQHGAVAAHPRAVRRDPAAGRASPARDRRSC
jgi:uncharacterized membrane protein YdfJ with MMPL/SSD domain